MHEVLVKRVVKLAQEKVWSGNMTIAVDWDVKHHIKQKHNSLIWFETILL